MNPVVLAIVVFTATNIDDIFLLLAFFSNANFKSREIIIGQYLGVGLLFILSVAAAQFALLIPGAWIGLLGIVPLLLGIRRLLLLRSVPLKDRQTMQFKATHRGHVLEVAATTFSCGGDNLSVYIPFLTTCTRPQIALTSVVFVLLIAFWCVGARLLVRNPPLGAYFQRFGHIFTPLVFIGLGIWILQKLVP